MVINLPIINNSYIVDTTNKSTFLMLKNGICLNGVYHFTKIATKMMSAQKFSISDSELTVWPLIYFGNKFKFSLDELNILNQFGEKAYTKLIFNFEKNNLLLIHMQLYELSKQSFMK